MPTPSPLAGEGWVEGLRLAARPGVAILNHRLVVPVKIGFQKQNSGDPPRDIGDLARLLACQGPAQQALLAIAQPLLDDLVTTDVIVPYRRGMFFQ